MSQGSNSTETITLLFTDLVGSTELMAGLEADVADTVRRDHFARLQVCVDRAGGRLVKNLGDGVMAVFGSSSAAIECAVGMQQDVERAARRHGVALRIRIGVAAGDVLVEDGDCFGSPVVEGARLCDLAKGGQILATEIVGRMASGRSKARLAALGEMELKGLPEPVPVVEVGWSASRATAGLLERAEELERLDGRLRGGRGGQRARGARRGPARYRQDDAAAGLRRGRRRDPARPRRPARAGLRVGRGAPAVRGLAPRSAGRPSASGC